jgi:hypothetical protein
LGLLLIALTWAASLCVSAPAVAAGRAGSAAATRAYLRASEAYVGEASAEVGASVAAIEARASEIAGECPSALTFAPRDEAFGELSEEMSRTLFYAGVAPMSAIRLTLARAIGRLSWSDRRLTRLVRVQAAVEMSVVELPLPDVCADIAAWKASDYAALPQNATGFLARIAAIDSKEYVGPSEEWLEVVIKHLLEHYEGPVERRTMKLIERREQGIGRMLGAAQEAALARLATGLGVSTL